MRTASATPSTNDRISAPMTRASVTRTSIGVIVSRLCPMRAKLGIAKAGMPSVGARYDSASHKAAKIRSETTACRENFPSRLAASRCSSGCINDLVVRHGLVEAGLDRALHHVRDRLAGGGLPPPPHPLLHPPPLPPP